MDVQLDPVHSAAADDVVQARVADQHPSDIGGRVRAFEVAFDAAEASGVLVDVESTTRLPCSRSVIVVSRVAMWQKIAAPTLESAAPRPQNQPSATVAEVGE